MTQQRNTRQRQLVLDAVTSRCDHPTAEQVYQDVIAKDAHVSKATVYRNLELLSANNQLTQVNAPGASRFDLRREPHPHLSCVRCGKVVDAPWAYQQADDEQVSAETGFTVFGHQTMFTGLCPECSKVNQ